MTDIGEAFKAGIYEALKLTHQHLSTNVILGATENYVYKQEVAPRGINADVMDRRVNRSRSNAVGGLLGSADKSNDPVYEDHFNAMAVRLRLRMLEGTINKSDGLSSEIRHILLSIIAEFQP